MPKYNSSSTSFNLYYRAIYGNNERVIRGAKQNIEESFVPYRSYLKRAINADQERKIGLRFSIVHDKKTLIFRPLNRILKIQCKGKLKFYPNFDIIKLENLHQAILDYEIDLNEEKDLQFVYYDEDNNIKVIKIPTNQIIRTENEDSEEGYYDYFVKNSELKKLYDQIKSGKEIELNYKKIDINLSCIDFKEDNDLILEYNNEVIDYDPESLQYNSENQYYEVEFFGILPKDGNLMINDINVKNFRINSLITPKSVVKVVGRKNNIKTNLKILGRSYTDELIEVENSDYNVNNIYAILDDGSEQKLKPINLPPLREIKFQKDDDIFYPIKLITSSKKGNEYIIDENLFPEKNCIVFGSNGLEYECSILNKEDKNLKIQLFEDEMKFSDLSKKAEIEYFFEDDVRSIMEFNDFDKSRKSNGIFDIERKNYEERTIIIRTPTKKSYGYLKQRFEKIEREKRKIFINRNSYQLETQLFFINNLIQKPLDDHLPLLRLGENIERTKQQWKSFEKKHLLDKDWIVLTDPEYEGTKEQRKFVENSLNTPDFAFLEGPPGSGKTTAIIELIFQLVKRDKKILLAASTHVAIDNVLERIKKDYPEMLKEILPLRIGDIFRISEEIQEYQIDNILTSYNNHELNDFDEVILEASNLVCGTVIGILKHPWFYNEKNKKKKNPISPIFDYLIIDESSKTTFQEFIIPAQYCKKWILVGDINQLSPYAESDYLKRYFEGIIDNNNHEIYPINNQTANFFLFLTLKNYFYQYRGILLENKSRKQPKIIIPIDSSILRYLEIELKTKYQYFKNQDKKQIDYSKRFPRVVIIKSGDNNKEDYNESGYFCITENDLKTGDSKTHIIEICNLIFTDINFYKSNYELFPHNAYCINLSHAEILPQNYQWDYYFKDEIKKKRYLRFFNEINSSIQEKSWASEISWRIIRLYELRNVNNSGSYKRYSQDVSLLEPKSTDITKYLINAWSIALPSLLESLQNGIPDKYRGDYKTVLKFGFPNDIFSERHIILDFQYRMHKDISKFPRKEFYNEHALKDSKKIDRSNFFDRYKSRMTWINVDRGYWKTKNKPEATRLIHELKRFQHWAMNNPKEDNSPWTVACLTYYRSQERLLRDMLRNMTGQTNKYSIFEYYNLKIILHTVDKIQGREADIIFISMTRSASNRGGGNLGFMDNPNRLNVALTRAKYQLVIIGQLKNFEDQNESIYLKDLTQSVTRENISDMMYEKKRQKYLNSKNRNYQINSNSTNFYRKTSREKLRNPNSNQYQYQNQRKKLNHKNHNNFDKKSKKDLNKKSKKKSNKKSSKKSNNKFNFDSRLRW